MEGAPTSIVLLLHSPSLSPPTARNANLGLGLDKELTVCAKSSPFLWFQLTCHIESYQMTDPPLGEAAWPEWAWGWGSVCPIPHRQVHWSGHIYAHFPVQSFSANKDDALVSPCKLFYYVSDGHIYRTPLNTSTVLLQRIQEFRGQGVALNLECKGSSAECISNANSSDLRP